MLIAEKLCLNYPGRKHVLEDVSFELKRGGVHFLSGASGAGKSSLLALLSLSLRPSGGKLSLFGENVTHLPREDYPNLRRRIGTVYQDYRLLNHLTVEENVALPLKVAGEAPAQITEKVTELLAWVGLSEYHKARPQTLSGGQKQRVAIARAVITKPDLLLADEPTGNLDLPLSLKFMYLFEALGESGTTILIATHDEHLMSKFKHPVLRLADGRVESVN